jgi:hypothetical protein
MRDEEKNIEKDMIEELFAAKVSNQCTSVCMCVCHFECRKSP